MFLCVEYSSMLVIFFSKDFCSFAESLIKFSAFGKESISAWFDLFLDSYSISTVLSFSSFNAVLLKQLSKLGSMKESVFIGIILEELFVESETESSWFDIVVFGVSSSVESSNNEIK